MEYLLENVEWLEEQIKELKTNYIIFDCPGQVSRLSSCLIFLFRFVLTAFTFQSCPLHLCRWSCTRTIPGSRPYWIS
jgi:hypothetical protein